MESSYIFLGIVGFGCLVLAKAHRPNMTTFGNELRVGMTGIFPDFYIDENDHTKGSEITALRFLSEKMGFRYNICLSESFDDLVNKVCFNEIHMFQGFHLSL